VTDHVGPSFRGFGWGAATVAVAVVIVVSAPDSGQWQNVLLGATAVAVLTAGYVTAIVQAVRQRSRRFGIGMLVGLTGCLLVASLAIIVLVAANFD
jgi:drug/metabolite transporter (DMT)-like permease